MELELDSRIKPGKRPLNCFDTEQAMQFIGKQCYFSDDATDFMDLDKADGDSMFYIAELQNIWTAEEYCFADNSNDWRYILPVEFVNGQETESESAQIIKRPFTLKEFLTKFKIMYPVRYRPITRRDFIIVAGVMGWFEDKGNEEDGVIIGSRNHSLKDLFDYYEFEQDGQWFPFSIQETKGDERL